MCQCPQRASTHFFSRSCACSKEFCMCQCPQRASTHFFLLTDIWEENTEITSVNALNGLLLISSKDGKLQWVIGNCVNALNGLLLISSRMKDVELPKESVSMPSTGFYSFLHISQVGRLNEGFVCQCPQRASTHFFGTIKPVKGSQYECVNALNGLLLISSVPSQNP